MHIYNTVGIEIFNIHYKSCCFESYIHILCMMLFCDHEGVLYSKKKKKKRSNERGQTLVIISGGVDPDNLILYFLSCK
jgi:hypothetical protein